MELAAIILGIALGLIWASIMVSTMSTMNNVVILLGYCLGISVMYMVSAIVVNVLFNIFTRLRKVRGLLLHCAALFFAVVGVLIIIGKFPFLCR